MSATEIRQRTYLSDEMLNVDEKEAGNDWLKSFEKDMEEVRKITDALSDRTGLCMIFPHNDVGAKLDYRVSKLRARIADTPQLTPYYVELPTSPLPSFYDIHMHKDAMKKNSRERSRYYFFFLSDQISFE